MKTRQQIFEEIEALTFDKTGEYTYDPLERQILGIYVAIVHLLVDIRDQNENIIELLKHD